MRGYRQPRPHDYVGKCMNSSAVSQQRVVGSSLEGACLNQGMQVKKKKLSQTKHSCVQGQDFVCFMSLWLGGLCSMLRGEKLHYEAELVISFINKYAIG